MGVDFKTECREHHSQLGSKHFAKGIFIIKLFSQPNPFYEQKESSTAETFSFVLPFPSPNRKHKSSQICGPTE